MWRLSAAALLLAGCHAAGHCLSGEDLTAGQCAQIEQIALPAELPPARDNPQADDPAAAALGFQLFYDARLSGNQQVRCASCHAPERAFGDGQPTPRGHPGVQRNTPTVLNAARLGTLTWDGRAQTIAAQAMQPLENPAEMDFTRQKLAERLRQSYRALYEKAFGPMPETIDDAAVESIAANTGKAFEAYLRKLAAGPSRADRWLGGEKSALSADETHGLAVLARAGCLGCHAGPMLTDEKFHDLGVPAWPGAKADLGRAGVLPASASAGERAAALGAFRTPPLRNLTRSAPYGHNGRFATLEDAVDFHLEGAGRSQKLSPADRAALLAALRALDGEPPRPPWNNWPQN